jgi:hypothetical protein
MMFATDYSIPLDHQLVDIIIGDQSKPDFQPYALRAIW